MNVEDLDVADLTLLILRILLNLLVNNKVKDYFSCLSLLQKLYFWFSKIEHAQKALKKPEEEKLITFIPSADVSLVPKVTSTCQL